MSKAPSTHVAGKPRPNWSTAEVEGCPFGLLLAAVCPGSVPSSVFNELLQEEITYASELQSPKRRREWVAGRFCLARALQTFPTARSSPILPMTSGAPTAPAGFAASISHKGPLAMALVAETRGGLGVDVDCVSSWDAALERKVLTPGERARLGDRGEQETARFVLAHFSVKEAVYKALLPSEQDTLEFDDIELVIDRIDNQIWLTPSATLAGRTAVVRAAFLLDDDWVVAAAFRAVT
jgi:phosphopantetheine--protein transferase-like protein